MRKTIVGALLMGMCLIPMLIGCSKKSTNSITNPSYQPQSANLTDDFSFQATNVSRVTQTVTYTWQMTGTVAKVDQSCSVTGGTATLILKDAVGIQVYSKNLALGGTFDSAAGTAGVWTIQVVLSNFSGSLNYRVQKKT
jgi:hypothetical protein